MNGGKVGAATIAGKAVKLSVGLRARVMWRLGSSQRPETVSYAEPPGSQRGKDAANNEIDGAGPPYAFLAESNIQEHWKTREGEDESVGYSKRR